MAAEATLSAADDIRAATVQYRIKITPKLVLSILGPFVFDKVKEQVAAVAPISLFLLLFQLIVLRQGIVGAIGITLGLSVVILGLMLFMEGLRLGLMPLGENIGATLPRKARMWLILAFAFMTGLGATYAEPAISTLKAAGANIKPEEAPLLFEMLNRSSPMLVLMVGVGVGIATVLGIYRFAKGWSLKTLLFPGLATGLGLTVIAQLHPATRDVIALAWDTGGVTTGPVTVPLVLALGLGVSAVLGKSDTGMSGFGIVTLASIWPVIMVLSLSLVVFYTGGVLPPAEAAAQAQAAAVGGSGEQSFLSLVAVSMLAALQAIIPLAAFLLFVQRVLLRERIRNLDQIVLGLVICLLGLGLFSLGLSLGLVPLGGQVGGNVPLAFKPPEALYGEVGGKVVAVIFAFILGYGATLAEPALNALGMSVEEVTAGAFKKSLLIQAVAIGVGLGLGTGIAKVMFSLPIFWLIIPPYLGLTVVTWFSDEKYTNIGWDSAGVTTGPITVPLVLAMGLGVGTSVGVADGFGMLAMASIGPILTVLVLGLVVSRTGAKAPAPAQTESEADLSWLDEEIVRHRVRLDGAAPGVPVALGGASMAVPVAAVSEAVR
ncbi:MAG TPA: DUF1538 domain-containing protein [Chloroflexota bacterium]|nr:DUF1538 domain-containing protein [Chloroflexota bacterium]